MNANAVAVTERRILGDRAYALIDRETGKVASARPLTTTSQVWGVVVDGATGARLCERHELRPLDLAPHEVGARYSG